MKRKIHVIKCLLKNSKYRNISVSKRSYCVCLKEIKIKVKLKKKLEQYLIRQSLKENH